MRAGIVALRIGSSTDRTAQRLVGVRCDTDATREAVRRRFLPWLDDDVTVTDWAFDLELHQPESGAGVHRSVDRGPMPVPQLRRGSTLIARARRGAEVIDALDGVLGGLAGRLGSAEDAPPADRSDGGGVWLWLRPFLGRDRAVLVDAAGPTLTNDPGLARAGVDELAAWSVEVLIDAEHDAPVVRVPASLTGRRSEARRLLGGLVAVGASHAGDPRPSDAALLARYAAMNDRPDWFRIVDALVRAGDVVTVQDAAAARRAIRGLL